MGLPDGANGTLTIPEQYNGVDIVKSSVYIFANNQELQHLVVSDNMTELTGIGYAFNLKSITFSSSGNLTRISGFGVAYGRNPDGTVRGMPIEGLGVFTSPITIPASVTTIEGFDGRTGTINYPSTVNISQIVKDNTPNINWVPYTP